MNKLELDTETDETGRLDVRLPGRPAAYRVHVTVEWESANGEGDTWPAGWLDATAGSIDDPSFVRPQPGAFEVRKELE